MSELDDASVNSWVLKIDMIELNEWFSEEDMLNQSDFWYKVHGLCYAVHYVCSVLVLEVILLCLLHNDALLIELSWVE